MAIPGVVYEEHGADMHEDPRRVLVAPYNSDFADFPRPGQVKSLVMSVDCRLGDHYHSQYAEGFSAIGFGVPQSDGSMKRNPIVFALEDPSTQEREDYVLTLGARLLIPAGIAHTAFAPAGSVLLGFEAKPYKPGRSDTRYDLHNVESAIALLEERIGREFRPLTREEAEALAMEQASQ